MNMYAYWEKNHTGWNLVVYHNDYPRKPVGGDAPDRQGPFEVPASMLSVDGSPIMGKIRKAFPLNQGEGE